MSTPAITPSVNTPIPQSAGGAAVPLAAPARSTQREAGNSLGTFGVCVLLYYSV